jgi:hypothetical protein
MAPVERALVRSMQCGEQEPGGSAADAGAAVPHRTDCFTKFDAATDALVAAGFFTAVDTGNVKAGARNLPPALVP